MFKRGDRIHLHDGTTVRVRKTGTVPKAARPSLHGERPFVRGFVRGALVNPDGSEVPGDWHENTITVEGHRAVVRNFIGLVSSATSAMAANISDLQLARYFAVGYVTAVASDLSTLANVQSEYGLQSNSTYNAAGASRATVSAGQQVLSGTWSLQQSFQYASTQIANGASINAVGQHSHSGVGNGSVLSVATFASSTKGTTQALNISYNWVFSNT